MFIYFGEYVLKYKRAFDKLNLVKNLFRATSYINSEEKDIK